MGELGIGGYVKAWFKTCKSLSSNLGPFTATEENVFLCEILSFLCLLNSRAVGMNLWFWYLFLKYSSLNW